MDGREHTALVRPAGGRDVPVLGDVASRRPGGRGAFLLNKLGYLDRDQRAYEKHREDRAALVEAVRAPEQLVLAAADPTLGKALRTGRLATSSPPWTAAACVGGRRGVHGNRPIQRPGSRWPLQQRTPRPVRHRTGCRHRHRGVLRRSSAEPRVPVGLPSVWSWQSNEKPPTLGCWLRRNENDLVPGLWTCTVSGKLPFEQDLLVSCLVKVESIRRASDPDGGDIPRKWCC